MFMSNNSRKMVLSGTIQRGEEDFDCFSSEKTIKQMTMIMAMAANLHVLLQEKTLDVAIIAILAVVSAT